MVALGPAGRHRQGVPQLYGKFLAPVLKTVDGKPRKSSGASERRSRYLKLSSRAMNLLSFHFMHAGQRNLKDPAGRMNE